MRFIYHHRIASKDGQTTHIDEVVNSIKAAGHECIICAPNVHTNDSGTGGSAGWVGVLRRSLPGAVYELAETAYMFILFARLLRATLREKPDVIYERYALFNVAGVWVSKLTGVPLIMEVNTPYAESRAIYNGLKLRRFAQWIEELTWRGANVVLPVSSVMADIVVKAGVPRNKIHVIPNAINPEDFANLPDATKIRTQLHLDNTVIIGFTGFVREWDHLDRILTWMSENPQFPFLHLLIVGDGPVRGELEDQAKALRISHRLHFTGIVKRTDVATYAQVFDVALQTALVPYASPLCLFEYLALGKPIVAPDQPNHHEILNNGIDSLLFTPGSETSIGQCISKLADDPVLRRTLGKNARATLIRRQFTWQKNAEKIIKIAEELVIQRT